MMLGAPWDYLAPELGVNMILVNLGRLRITVDGSTAVFHF